MFDTFERKFSLFKMIKSNTNSSLESAVIVDLGWSLTGEISDDHWDEIQPQQIRTWETACDILNRGTILFGDTAYDYDVNLSPVIRRLKYTYSVMKRIYARTPPNFNFADFRHTPVSIRFNLVCKNTPQTMNGDKAFFVTHILSDIFVAMNIAFPGSCNFYSTRIKSKRRYPAERFRLSSNPFEMALLDSKAGKWPRVDIIPITQCHSWLKAIRPRLNLIPQNRMERVLFALLHIAREEISPPTIIWLFYAFEALFDTKVGENFRSLIDRIALLLNPTDTQLAYLRRTMRELYNLRSSFVHGGMEVFHPFAHEISDKSVESVYYKLMGNCNNGFRILLSCIQEVVRQNWREPSFKEMIAGVPQY